jgi:hypothetical protein
MGGPLTEEEAHVIAGALELREKTGEVCGVSGQLRRMHPPRVAAGHAHSSKRPAPSTHTCRHATHACACACPAGRHDAAGQGVYAQHG